LEHGETRIERRGQTGTIVLFSLAARFSARQAACAAMNR
jgi:hypothetical protein